MPPRAGLVMLQREGHKPRLAIVGRRHRSKWWNVVCWCKRPRKDGTCLWTDGLVENLVPGVRAHAHLEHPDVGVTVRIPPASSQDTSGTDG